MLKDARRWPGCKESRVRLLSLDIQLQKKPVETKVNRVRLDTPVLSSK